MTERDRKGPNKTDKTLEREAERRKRLAEALRENLRKRKAPNPSPPNPSAPEQAPMPKADDDGIG